MYEVSLFLKCSLMYTGCSCRTIHYVRNWGQGSSFGIETRLLAELPRSRGSISGRNNTASSITSREAQGCPASGTVGTMYCFLGYKAAGARG
jgi:hypothetical protein